MKLSPKFLKKQKEVLLKEEDRLEEKIKKLKKYPDLGFADDDNTQETIEFEEQIPLENEAEKILKKVKSAVLAVEKGTYGKCRKCKKTIEEEHLEIIPYADLCVKCSPNKKK